MSDAYERAWKRSIGEWEQDEADNAHATKWAPVNAAIAAELAADPVKRDRLEAEAALQHAADLQRLIALGLCTREQARRDLDFAASMRAERREREGLSDSFDTTQMAEGNRIR